MNIVDYLLHRSDCDHCEYRGVCPGLKFDHQGYRGEGIVIPTSHTLYSDTFPAQEQRASKANRCGTVAYTRGLTLVFCLLSVLVQSGFFDILLHFGLYNIRI